MQIPFVNLKKTHDKLRSDFYECFDNILEQSEFINGSHSKLFEQAFCNQLGIKNNQAIACSNGTTALFVALKLANIGAGDEVIIPVNTFIATAEAVVHVGATPVFADIDTSTQLISTQEIESKLSDKTKAIIPVHLYGTPCDMDEIVTIAKKHNLLIIEDCAQAHFALYKNKAVGTFGDFSAFSFFPGKNLGALGDAGLTFCKNLNDVEKARKLINHGRSEKYIHESIGYNLRIDELQAAFLNIKLKHISHWNTLRTRNADEYKKLLNDSPVKVLDITPNSNPVYHLFVIKCRPSDRERIQDMLKKMNIQTGIHYPLPLHLQPAFSYLKYKKGDFPNAEKSATQILSLPMCPNLTIEEIHYICNIIKKFS